MFYEIDQFETEYSLFDFHIEKLKEKLEKYTQSGKAKESYIKAEESRIEKLEKFKYSCLMCFQFYDKKVKELPDLRKQLTTLKKKYESLELLALSKGIDISLVPYIDPNKDTVNIFDK